MLDLNGTAKVQKISEITNINANNLAQPYIIRNNLKEVDSENYFACIVAKYFVPSQCNSEELIAVRRREARKVAERTLITNH